MMKNLALAGTSVLMSFVLVACSHQSTARRAQPQTVYSDYDTAINGRFALFVDTAAMARDPEFKWSGCDAYTIKLSADVAMRETLLATLKKIVRDSDLVEAPIAPSDLAAAGFDGMIVVEIDEYSVEVDASSAWISTDLTADAELQLSYKVDVAGGRRSGASFIEAAGSHTGPLGVMCSGAGEVAAGAVEKAMASIAAKASERISNSSRLRDEFRTSPTTD
ncbi:hypothetical protein [Pyruvatibacter sp.]|uniref:hypothetical protein n=1 Tax=Pyruvatibacter sp. TaxID=1981328 RepID=UPI003267F1CB